MRAEGRSVSDQGWQNAVLQDLGVPRAGLVTAAQAAQAAQAASSRRASTLEAQAARMEAVVNTFVLYTQPG
jgi:hypothetical protein